MCDDSIVAVKDKLNDWKSFVEMNGFFDDGEYKGCYVETDIIDKLESSHVEDDDVFSTMYKLANFTEKEGPVLRNSQKFLSPNESNFEILEDDDLLPLDSEMTMESHQSQPTEFQSLIQRQLSQSNVEICEPPFSGYDIDNSTPCREGVQRGSDTWNNTIDAMDLIRNKEDEEIWNEAANKVNGRWYHDSSIFSSELSDFRKAGKRHKQSLAMSPRRTFL